MKATVAIRTPKDVGLSGWYAMLPPPTAPNILKQDIDSDWVIIGAGFAGLFAARRLWQLRPKDKIVVLDAQRIAWGAAGRNSGFMIDLPHELQSESYSGANAHDLALINTNRTAISIAREAAGEAGLSGVFNPCGKYHGAAGAEGLNDLKSFESHLNVLGEKFTSLGSADMRRITGTDYYVGGTHTPGAVIIQPAAYVRGLADHLGSKVEIYENSPALRIEHGGVHRVSTPSGSVRAPRIILANNGQLESFGYFKQRLMHVYLYASMTRALTGAEQAALGGEPQWALIPADPMGSTVRRIKENRILIRNTATYNPNMAVTEETLAKIGYNHDRSFAARFPMLKDVAMEYRWSGHLCLSRNSASAFGEVDERVYAAGCCNGLGTTKSTLAGHLVAELACGVKSDLLDQQLSQPKPSKLLPSPVMAIGAPMRLRWLEHKAGADF